MEFVFTTVAPIVIGAPLGWLFGRLALGWLVRRFEWMGARAFRVLLGLVSAYFLALAAWGILFEIIADFIVKDPANAGIDGPQVFMAAGFISVTLSFWLIIGWIIGFWFGARKWKIK